jgi:hypothetical protein
LLLNIIKHLETHGVRTGATRTGDFTSAEQKKKKEERNVMGIRATARSWGECKGALSGQKKRMHKRSVNNNMT